MTAQRSRAKKLEEELQIQYPLWVFDVDQQYWPRKLASIPPGARPAKVVGWWCGVWEYGTNLARFDDPPSTSNYTIGLVKDKRIIGSTQQLLKRLQYDSDIDPTQFTVLYHGGSAETLSSKSLNEWVYDSTSKGYIPPHQITRIERQWDQAGFFDVDACINIWQGQTAESCTVYGLAIPVNNDSELLHAAGAPSDDHGKDIRKISFDFLDGDEEHGQGIVWPVRFWRQRGLYLNIGPDDVNNKSLLRGTALENASWETVEQYANGCLDQPLL